MHYFLSKNSRLFLLRLMLRLLFLLVETFACQSGHLLVDPPEIFPQDVELVRVVVELSMSQIKNQLFYLFQVLA